MTQPFTLFPDATASGPRFLPPPFSCSIASHAASNAATIQVEGDLDLATTPQLMEALWDAQRSADVVVLDLRGLTCVDTAGVRVIVDASLSARHAGRRLLLVRGRDNVQRMFGLTGTEADVEVSELSPDEPPIRALLAS